MLRFGGGQLHEVAVSGSTEPGREPTSGALFFWGNTTKNPKTKGPRFEFIGQIIVCFLFLIGAGGQIIHKKSEYIK